MDTDTTLSNTQPPPRPSSGVVSGVGGLGGAGGVTTVIKKVGKPPAKLVVRDAVPMFQCALCGMRYHLVDDLVKHVEKGQHFDIDACLDSGHEVRAGPSGSSSCSSPVSSITTLTSTSAFSGSGGSYNYEEAERSTSRSSPRRAGRPEVRSFARFGGSSGSVSSGTGSGSVSTGTGSGSVSTGTGSGEGQGPGQEYDEDRMLRLRSCSSMIQRLQSEGRGDGPLFRERRPTSTTTSSSMSTSDDAMSNSSFYQFRPTFNFHAIQEEQEYHPLLARHREAVNPESCPDEAARGPTSYSFRPRRLPYRCLKCSSTFETATELKNHSGVHALDCNYCERSFLMEASLEEHVQEEHPEQLSPRRGNVNVGHNVATIGDPEEEEEHELIVGDVEEQEEEFQGQDPDGQGHYQVGSIFESDVLIEALDGCYRCTVCAKVCTARSDMQKHVRRHTDERPYSCYICSERFKHRSAITNHLRIHTGERPYSCVYCGKQFSQHSNKRRHEALHRGERPFRCVLCGRTFSEKTTLQTHMLQHTGERPFICEVCQKGHITKSALTRHKCIHKRRTGRNKSATSTGGDEGDGGGSPEPFDMNSTGGTDSASYSSQ